MAGIATAEAKPPKKGPKVLDHLRISRSLEGGHVIEHHYTSYQHEPKPYKFGADEGERATAHIMRHAGLPPVQGNDESETEDEIAEKPEGEKKAKRGTKSAAVRGAGKHVDAEEPDEAD